MGKKENDIIGTLCVFPHAYLPRNVLNVRPEPRVFVSVWVQTPWVYRVRVVVVVTCEVPTEPSSCRPAPGGQSTPT